MHPTATLLRWIMLCPLTFFNEEKPLQAQVNSLIVWWIMISFQFAGFSCFCEIGCYWRYQLLRVYQEPIHEPRRKQKHCTSLCGNDYNNCKLSHSSIFFVLTFTWSRPRDGGVWNCKFVSEVMNAFHSCRFFFGLKMLWMMWSWTMWEKSTMRAVGFQQGSSGRQQGLVRVCQQEPCALHFSLSQMSTLCRLVSILPPAECSTNHLLQEHVWIECRLRFTSLGKGSLDKIQANTVALFLVQHCTWVEWFHGYHGTSMGKLSSFNQYRVPVVGTTPSISPLKHCKSRGKSSWYVYLKLHNRLLFCVYLMDCIVPWNITFHISGRPCIQKIANLG